MKKIGWCKDQENGIEIVNPNDNLSEEYYRNAEESLKVLRGISKIDSNMWAATTKYYIEYFAVYSVLMKLGVKCEIHDCTISLASFLEKEGVLKSGTFKVLERDKELRIDNQYYLKNRPVDLDFEKLADFLLSIRDALNKLNKDKIDEMRTKIINS